MDWVLILGGLFLVSRLRGSRPRGPSPSGAEGLRIINAARAVRAHSMQRLSLPSKLGFSGGVRAAALAGGRSGSGTGGGTGGKQHVAP